ncbi:MAG: prolyl 4-hydroxylase subunit alpha [Sphingobacteriales bacterium]|nr:MAG: prolyl 4-hydroxylase subunit alpha [Sphingobacteriales bacterium]
MKTIEQRIADMNWSEIHESLDSRGYALVPSVITASEAEGLINNYHDNQAYRKTVVMERYRFGLGEYRYFKYPLPTLIDSIRRMIYTELAPVANRWMECLNKDTRYPRGHQQLLEHCQASGQDKPTVLILKYGKGGHNTLHQDLYGDIFFPVQTVLFLNQPGVDYTGGEFVMTEQVPRAQSKAIVLTPGKGDMLMFTTNFRPVKGSRGYYRAGMKHGVSEVHDGKRFTLGIIFHDALT